MLGQFNTDPLEKEFGKLRMGSGGAYFITVRNVVEKTNIQHAKLALNLDMEMESYDGHKCSACTRALTSEECATFDVLSEPDNVSSIEDKLDESTKIGLVHISGYIQRRYEVNFDGESSFTYFDQYGSYTQLLDRGGLTKPNDTTVQWVFLCYFLFLNLDRTRCCRKSLINYFVDISDIHALNINAEDACILANILLNNYCKKLKPRASKETGQKALKLN